MSSLYVQLSRYTQPPIVVFGTIGALFNLVLFFNRKNLRSTSCSLYFRALSFNDLLVLYIIILPQWLRDQFQIDLTTKYDWCCRISLYLTFTLYAISPYCVVLACFDRLCTSSANARLRKIATIRVASFLIPIMIIIVFAAYCHVPIWYKLVTISTSSYCTVTDYDYHITFATFLLIFSCLAPPLLMLILCIITLMFLRQQRRRIMPVNQTRGRQRDNQLLKMLFIYVISNIICILPFSLTYFIQIYNVQNTSALVSILVQMFILLINVNYATSFYLYTLGTPFYRDELFNLVKIIWQRIRGRDIVIINQ
jgi:hypothetical protein